MEIINFKKKKMKLLTKEQHESYICEEKFEDKHAKDKRYCKVKDDCHNTGEYRGAGHNLYIDIIDLKKFL